MPIYYLETKEKLIAAAISAAGWVITFTVLMLLKVWFMHAIALGLFVALIPAAFVQHFNQRWVNQVEEKLPDFLFDLASLMGRGISFSKAWEMLTHKNYGLLSVEVRRAYDRLSWGETVEEVMDKFVKNLRIPTGQAVGEVVKQVIIAGEKAYKPLIDFALSLRAMTYVEREARERTYGIMKLMYLCLGALYATAWVFIKKFYPTILEASGYFLTPVLSLEDLRVAFYLFALTSSIGYGLIVGELCYGDFRNGMKHLCAMVFLTFLVFYLMDVITWI